MSFLKIQFFFYINQLSVNMTNPEEISVSSGIP